MSSFTIPASARSSDGAQEFEFDALPFFERADDQEVVELAKRDFAGGYPGELVFQRCREGSSNGGFEALLGYLALAREQNPLLSLHCRVDAEAAKSWLDANRPLLAARVARRPEVDAAIERRLKAIEDAR